MYEVDDELTLQGKVYDDCHVEEVKHCDTNEEEYSEKDNGTIRSVLKNVTTPGLRKGWEGVDMGGRGGRGGERAREGTWEGGEVGEGRGQGRGHGREER